MDGRNPRKKEIGKSCVFGPVLSRRLGFSLGVDPIPFKTCTLNCIYCQLGKTTHLTKERKEYIPEELIERNLKEVLFRGKRIDYITLSGSGEPTLNSRIGELIKNIKKLTQIPVVMLTNGTLLREEKVREALLSLDLLLPSLDTAIQGTFEKINRPCPGLKIKEIIEGMVKFRKIYRGEIWLEIMLVKGINDKKKELEALREAIEKICPDKIQLNTPVRPPSEKGVNPLERKKIEKIKEFFGKKCEIIPDFKKKKQRVCLQKKEEEEIFALLSRRPVTPEEISASLGLDLNRVLRWLERLKIKKRVRERIYHQKRYFSASQES